MTAEQLAARVRKFVAAVASQTDDPRVKREAMEVLSDIDAILGVSAGAYSNDLAWLDDDL